MNLCKVFLVICFIIYGSNCSYARIHKFRVSNDTRRYIKLSDFGYNKGGTLEVNLTDFDINNRSDLFGFTIDKIRDTGLISYLNKNKDGCVLERNVVTDSTEEIIYLVIDLNKMQLQVVCVDDQPLTYIHILDSFNVNIQINICRSIYLKLIDFMINDKMLIDISFVFSVKSLTAEGNYNLFFHNCVNHETESGNPVNFDVKIVEHNEASYLSAGELPLSVVSCLLSLLFFISGILWLTYLNKMHVSAISIHYMLDVYIFLKALILVLDGVNYYYIGTFGFNFNRWAVPNYIFHMFKEALLAVILILISTGWSFTKHVLTTKDKLLLLIITPLQVLSHIILIILKDTEVSVDVSMWRSIALLLDMFCSCCILCSVMWSIRQLQKSLQTDYSGTIKLRKIRLLKHFLIMFATYAYLSGVIAYLITISVPFQYLWLKNVFVELTTYIFFVLISYKFRPVPHDKYLVLMSQEEDADVVSIFSEFNKKFDVRSLLD